MGLRIGEEPNPRDQADLDVEPAAVCIRRLCMLPRKRRRLHESRVIHFPKRCRAKLIEYDCPLALLSLGVDRGGIICVGHGRRVEVRAER